MGIPAESGIGTVGITQSERTRALQSIRDGQARVCVATDVAARGLDLPDLGLVIHADMPTNKATLLHRSGRTGRAGRKGLCCVIVPSSRVRAAETLFAAAGISASWSGPPLAEEIRALDGKRLLEDSILTEEAAPDDRVLARALLQASTPEDIAAALIRVYRTRLPAPEEITDISQPPPRQPRTPYGARARAEAAAGKAAPSGAVWFSMPVGRAAKADPKWLLPMICRLGGVDRAEVGAIRILASETRFEITAGAALSFEAHATAGGEVRVTRSEPPAADTKERRSFLKKRTKKLLPV